MPVPVALTAGETHALQQLGSIAWGVRFSLAMSEAQRRAILFEKCWKERPEPSPDESPLEAGLRSVYLDVTYGRL